MKNNSSLFVDTLIAAANDHFQRPARVVPCVAMVKLILAGEHHHL